MPRFSANLEFLFPEIPFLDRFAAAAEQGFVAVEYMFPYHYGVGALAQALKTNRLQQDLFNLPAGDFAAGERGVAVDPSRIDEFARGVGDASAIARELGCTKVNCLVGKIAPEWDWEEQLRCLLVNLRSATQRLLDDHITLHVELLNPLEAPGYFLNNLSLAEALLRDVPGLMFQCDLYHIQRTNGELIGTIRRLQERIGHYQIADAPERGEPGTGEINYRRVLTEIDATGYSGRVGLEYKPSKATAASLDWVGEYGYDLD